MSVAETSDDAALAQRLQVGVHLRASQLQEDSLLEPIRAQGSTIGASCHNADDLARAEALGCSFAVLGPVRATATHPGAAGIGWERFAELREQVSLPIYAIGGMTSSGIADGRGHGAQGIAAIRGLWNP